MRHDLFQIQPALQKNRTLTLGERDEKSAALPNEFRCVVSHVAEALNDHTLPADSRSNAEGSHILGKAHRLSQREVNTAARALRASSNASVRDGLPRHASGRVDRPG